jgi:hypothetical protein
MPLKLVTVVSLLAAMLWLPAEGAAQTVEEFYKSKSLTMLVGSGAGGGYDTYARIFARHMSRYIPGNPTIIAKNMPAPAGLAAANTLYTTADKDGSTIAAFTNGSAMEPLFGNAERALRRAKVQLAGQHRQTAERLRHLASVAGQDDRSRPRARSHRGGRRRHVEHRDRAQGVERAHRHQIQGDRGLRYRGGTHPLDRARRGRGHLRPVLVHHESVAPALDPGQAAQCHRPDGPAKASRPARRAECARPRHRRREQARA